MLEKINSQLRAVSYSRVSTEEEKQLNALTKQITQNREVIQSKGWILIREYIDEGKSGTQTKSRQAYNRLYEDMAKEEFDIVVIKDQDRLMRNTKDWYLFVDRMTSNNKQLYISLDEAFYNPDNSLLTGIKAILAEEYSRHLSKKINTAHQNRQKKGESPIITNRTWGYRNISGTIQVDESEREIVANIFEMYAAGVGSRIISKRLSEKGVRNRNGGVLSESTIREIVKNPIYKGTAVMHKTHIDFTTKEKKKLSRAEWIYHENAVPPIVSSGLWLAANETIRQNSIPAENSVRGQKRGGALLSGKIVCGECGDKFWRNKRKAAGKSQKTVVYWYCSRYYRFGSRKSDDNEGCIGMKLKEEEIYSCLIAIGNQLISENLKKKIFNKVCKRIKNDKSGDTVKYEALELKKQEEKLTYKQKRLLNLLIDGYLEKEEYKEQMKQIEQQKENITADKIRIMEKNSEASLIPSYERMEKEIDCNMDYYIIVPLVSCHISEIIVFADKIEIITDFRGINPFVFKENEIKKSKGKEPQIFSMCTQAGRKLS